MNVNEKIAHTLLQARKDAHVSQEELAHRINVSKRTIYNWEKAIVSPTIEQTLDVFNALGLNPVVYFWQYIYTQPFDNSLDDKQVESAFNKLVSELDIKSKRALLYLFCGKHGSSPKAVLQLLLAHLHLPIKNRVHHSMSILNDYQMEAQLGTLICKDNIMPDTEILEKATNSGLVSAICKKYGYSLN